MSYGGGPIAGTSMDEGDIPSDGKIKTAVEVAFTTAPLSASPAFVDIGGDCRWWDAIRGRSGELERFQPGRASIVLDNFDRQYDSVNAAGPWFGSLKPMKRIRLRETINGVTYTQFDGFIDRWQLDYPDVGHDAEATVTATDLFKVLARTDLPLSVYHDLILDDAPELYWRLDETKNAEDDAALTALNSGTLASTANGTYLGPPYLGGEALVVNDPGTSMETTNAILSTGVPANGVEVAGANFDIFGGGTTSFVFEAWILPKWNGASNIWVMENKGVSSGARLMLVAGQTLRFGITTSVGTFDVDAFPVVPNRRYHVVAKFVSGQPLRLWVNGTLTTGATPTGALNLGKNLYVGTESALATDTSWVGNISHATVWRGTAAEAFGDAEVQAHYAAGTHPWQGDTPAVRASRVLDLVGVPAEMRAIDPGDVTLQSAELGHSALEHLRKIGETELGLLFVSRVGQLTLVDKFSQEARTSGAVLGDGPGEIGYREIVPDDGDGNIRNRATISRLNGVAKSAVDAASVDEYGQADYVLEGLLHDSDSYSQSYADWVVTEFGGQRRRIVKLEVGPPIPSEEGDVWPTMLGFELGRLVTVRSRPPGGGAMFEQVCVIEGIHQTGRPGENRTVSLTLSPEFSEPLF